ncbi:HK97 family phage prohead protease [Asaia bogorensis]|uniref:HK97 family phage prohead protease n=1 Tax=Asaia bogorensis TaxID=91915 RepID=UPI00285FEE93|nr:HK97 family phage prohead protease [Asaia bogorensis]MDR6182101.1 HK97 family phage prohead protease [Asaia bogorensis NBRC 16594]
MNDYLAAAFEWKFAPDAKEGSFEGYGSVFGHQDAHGDIVLPGAFAETLAERKAQGRSIPMHVMHGILGGDGLPVGVWDDASEDSHGLHLRGRLSGMDTDYGRRLYGLVKDGALGGLSIGFSVRKNGATFGTDPGGPRRQIRAANLHEVSLVDDPSNALARVTEMRRRFYPVGPQLPDLAAELRAASRALTDALRPGFSLPDPRGASRAG